MEKEIKPKNGYVFLALVLVLIVLTVASIASTKNPGFLVLILPILLLLKGFFTVSPNSSKVMVLFGEYDAYCKIVRPDFSSLSTFILRNIRTIDGVISTTTLTAATKQQ